MKLQYFTVDSFTSEPFTGNPAAVCPLEEDTFLEEKKNYFNKKQNMLNTYSYVNHKYLTLALLEDKCANFGRVDHLCPHKAGDCVYL